MKIIDEESSAYDDMIDAEEKAQDMLEELHDLAQEKIVKKLEIQLDFNETAMKPLELKMRMLEDATFGISESMQKIYNFSDSDFVVALDRILNPNSMASTNNY